MATSTDDLVEKSLNKFIDLTKKPEEFLCAQEVLFKKFKDSTKNVYDISKTTEQRKTNRQDSALPELITENFDEEQIWQEIELQNDSQVSELMSNIAGLTCRKLPITFCQLKARKEKAKTTDGLKKKVKFDSLEENDSSDENEVEKRNTDDDSSDDTDDDSSVDTDNELDKIKSRLTLTGEESDNDADFDFAALGEAFKDFDEDDEGDGDKGSDDESNIKNDELDNDFKFSGDKQQTANKARKKKSVVDDKFFRLADMEAFLVQEDAKFERERKNENKSAKQKKDDEESSDEEDKIDMFEAFPSDEEEDELSKFARYEDFFDPPNEDDSTKKVSRQKTKEDDDDTGNKESSDNDNSDEDGDSDEDDDSSDENDDSSDEVNEEDENVMSDQDEAVGRPDLLGNSESEGEDVADVLGGARKKEPKSTFEKRQEKLKEKIKKMEETSLAEKSWQLIGESSSQDRPENSLMEEHLEFENIAQLPPVITETTSHDLEQMIKQRIKDKAFNDVKRVIKPWEDPYEFKKRTILSQEKSTESLSQVYERAYMAQKNKEKKDEKNPAHRKIKKKLQSLFIKLDALSNFHYTPKPAAPDIKIVSNLPSIAMEEVAPVSASDSKLLAPEEVKVKSKGGVEISKREKSTTDRKREKRKSKADKKKRNKIKEEKMAILRKKHPELKEKLDRAKAKKKLQQQTSRVTLLKNHKRREMKMMSSKKFFTQLQEEVTTNQKAKAAVKRKGDKNIGKSAKKLKL